MDNKTTGIILHSVKYNDSSTIVTIYTKQFGRTSYMAYGVNKKKSTCRAALIQPLSIVELDVLHTPTKDLQRIRDIRVKHTFIGIPFDPVKNAIALFISELLFRSLKQVEPDVHLYDFLEDSLIFLDESKANMANFHLTFLFNLTRYLGFAPYVKDGNCFDLINGVFLTQKPLHSNILLNENSVDFKNFIKTDFQTMNDFILSRERRILLLDNILKYYQLHIPGFYELHSIPILHSLFD